MDKTTVIENKAGTWPRVVNPSELVAFTPAPHPAVAANPPTAEELAAETEVLAAEEKADGLFRELVTAEFPELPKETAYEQSAVMLLPSMPGFDQLEEAREDAARARLRLNRLRAERDRRIRRMMEGNDSITDKVRRLLGA